MLLRIAPGSWFRSQFPEPVSIPGRVAGFQQAAIASLTNQLDTLTSGLVRIGNVSRDRQDVQLSTASL